MGCPVSVPEFHCFRCTSGYITLYAAFFREGNFRLPMTKFTAAVLKNYSLHISQINALGLPRVTHFEFICRASRIEPTFEMFNVFYTVTYTGGFYSFNSRTSNVVPCSSNPPKSLHDWKQNFFYIRQGVIPVDIHYGAVSEGIPKVNVAVGFAQQAWYKKLTEKATSISQLEEMALVGAGMSLLWVPKNPFGVPVYGYQGKLGYNLLNALDPKAGGAMVEAIQKDGKSTWLDQIRNCFLHPNSESFIAYGNTVLGKDVEYVVDGIFDSTREEVIVLSSEGSDRSVEGLTPRSARAGPAQGAVNEPVNDDVEVPVETADQLETRKKAKADKPERKEKRAEEKATETPRKRPSTLPILDYVVFSDTLSGLGTGEKPRAAAILASKRAKLQKEASAAPLESDIDMGVFSGDRGNLLEEIYAASAPTGVKSGRTPRRIHISKITPPASPPSRTIDLSPPHDDPGEKKKQDDVNVEHVGEGGDDGACGAGGDGKGKGIDTEAESSEATQRQTIYTKHPPGGGGGGGATSSVVRSPEFENVRAGS
ncbi:hypothetical protein HanPI659440_Chr04g0158981 [Helianthus annuus]|nr:hypothetical protein HanPI659440_Chr04g0158981 [Helianthus annuus]